MIFVDDGRAKGEFGQVSDDRVRLASGAFATTGLCGALREKLALGEHAQRGIAQRKTLFERGNGDLIARAVVLDKTAPVIGRGWAQVVRRELFDQCLASPRRIRRNQHPAWIAIEEVAQRVTAGLAFLHQRQARCGRVAEILRRFETWMPDRADLDARPLIQPLTQRFGWQE